MQKVRAVDLLRLNIPKGNFFNCKRYNNQPCPFYTGSPPSPAATDLSVMTQTFDWHLY